MELIREGYTRVSDILRMFQAYSSVPREKLKKAQELGTDIHSAISQFFDQEFTPLDRKKSPYFDSFIRFYETHPLKPIIKETRLYDDSLKITGQLDMLCEMNGERVIIDWKTGSWTHREIWEMQGAFYNYILASNGLEKASKYLFVQLQKDGSEPFLHQFKFDPAQWELCYHAVKCHEYFQMLSLAGRH